MEPHDRSFRWARLLAALVLAVLVGFFAYNAGVAHGVATAVAQQVAAAPQGTPPPAMFAPYGYYRPWGFGLFFGPFFFFLLFVFVLRGLFWGGPWRRYGCYPRGYYGGGPGAFDEWHRRAHERMTQPPGGPAHDDDRSRS